MSSDPIYLYTWHINALWLQQFSWAWQWFFNPHFGYPSSWKCTLSPWAMALKAVSWKRQTSFTQRSGFFWAESFSATLGSLALVKELASFWDPGRVVRESQGCWELGRTRLGPAPATGEHPSSVHAREQASFVGSRRESWSINTHKHSDFILMYLIPQVR